MYSYIYSDNESNNSDSEEELLNAEDDEIILLGLCTLLDSRYLESRFRSDIAKSQECLINNIEIHTVFQSTGNKQQAPVELQLAIFLRRVGSKDDIFSICSRYGISEGTVYLYCKRIMLAILSLKSSLVVWPTGQIRKMVHSGFKDIGGFNNVIGTIDGTHIILGIAPLKQPEIYWNRKKKYSIQCQGIVDYRGIFIDYEIGWPGLVHDAKDGIIY
ncbi:3234_t:CDS:2 [Funneliformis geosporum]|uniref:3234_t:CDS:1 n=1 Tax=Funneliformis geosporum TaxID=1117311 RepID=A0A9W4SIU8_9GLOM|nr:3234_t:CDS:2 [Funneliformis geosporum]